MQPKEDFTEDQIRTLMLMERIGGSVSLFAVIFIFIAYSLVPRARNVQNTFIVFASISNIGASIASIIAFDGLKAGKVSALCQAQSFLFEMFMQSDPWWALAMAINVLLVFYFQATPESFQSWWWVYCVICYGGPFTIALVLLFVHNERRGPVYGEATIWCWVDRRWDDIRIYTYYMLIWVCIVGSILCYALVGYYVFRSRNRLRSFSSTRAIETRLQNLRIDNEDGCYGTVVTEVHITHSAATERPPDEQAHGHNSSKTSVSSSACPEREEFDRNHQNSPSHSESHFFSSVTATPSTTAPRQSPLARVASTTRSIASKFVIDDPIKRAYLRTSFLFAISVLVTWIPSSLNRIHSWIHGQSPFEFHVATAAVLPLQGLWNAIIFFITSWTTVRRNSIATKVVGSRDVTEHHQLDPMRSKATSPTAETHDHWSY